ncbi:hypothetical protein PAXRUDRAFT_170631 [Paxillus rubicundulus Ve08.2h10]|uniref:Uncharacterized protein n=1 Tax=Paxillus rubicundulus Ve08.2h10 TaxID=930991 RepID=A0A0D0D7G2_9AGAM|nr:hypothetical protein PAXRUDRAFT_170631 [Paxillus rubicundulus Ve08.2h10]
MPRIAHDPSLEAEPDFGSEAFCILRDIIILNDPTFNQQSAAEHLADIHRLDCACHLADWQAQMEEDEQAAVAAQVALQQQEDQEKAEQQAAEDAEKWEREKKKPKMKGFNADSMVHENILPCPSQYAIHKLRAFKYVKLWYFTPEGCLSTLLKNKSTANGSYTFTKDGPGFLLLKSTALHRPSSKVLHDHDLSWRQFNIGKNNFLLHIARMDWPAEHQATLAMFFIAITSHEIRTQPKGEQILLQYASQVHREWHDSLISDDEGFNISTFNDALPIKILNTTWINAQAESLKQVSVFSPPCP